MIYLTFTPYLCVNTHHFKLHEEYNISYLTKNIWEISTKPFQPHLNMSMWYTDIEFANPFKTPPNPRRGSSSTSQPNLQRDLTSEERHLCTPISLLLVHRLCIKLCATVWYATSSLVAISEISHQWSIFAIQPNRRDYSPNGGIFKDYIHPS